jgi:hypothetical protein
LACDNGKLASAFPSRFRRVATGRDPAAAVWAQDHYDDN